MQTQQDLLDAWPGIRIDVDNAEYYRGLLEQRLMIQRCDACDRFHHPPRAVCPGCWSREVSPHEVSGRGTVALLTILYQGPPHPRVDYTQGHATVAVELDEQPGLRVAGAVVGVRATAVPLGAPVEVCFRDLPGQPPAPEFRLIG